METKSSSWSQVLSALSSNSPEQWLQGSLLFIGLWLLFLLLKRILTRREEALDAQGGKPIRLLLLAELGKLGIPVALPFFLLLCLRCLNDVPELHKWVYYALLLGLAFRGVRFAQAVIQFALDQALSGAEGERRQDLASLRNLSWLINFLLWAIALVFILSNAGVNVSSALAGLGIGGIAVAFAAQKLLGDLLASITLLLDRPFRLGELIKVEDALGQVERIGLRSTRLRSVNGEEISIPNSNLASSKIYNLSRAKRRRVALLFSLPLKTSSTKREALPGLISETIQGIRGAESDLVQIAAIHSSGLDLEIGYFVPANDPSDTRNLQHEVNLAILKRLESEGISIASPAQQFEVLERKSA